MAIHELRGGTTREMGKGRNAESLGPTVTMTMGWRRQTQPEGRQTDGRQPESQCVCHVFAMHSPCACFFLGRAVASGHWIHHWHPTGESTPAPYEPPRRGLHYDVEAARSNRPSLPCGLSLRGISEASSQTSPWSRSHPGMGSRPYTHSISILSNSRSQK